MTALELLEVLLDTEAGATLERSAPLPPDTRGSDSVSGFLAAWPWPPSKDKRFIESPYAAQASIINSLSKYKYTFAIPQVKCLLADKHRRLIFAEERSPCASYWE
ncbi:hypothetical protein [Chitinimonas sp.]|uniref:hypothetical protein n=1 Tax=Chitinimonas sp. TaxID=1934313 RepID=UPI0035AFD81C